MSIWNTMLTTKKNLEMRHEANFESEKKEGAVSANISILQKQVRGLQGIIRSHERSSILLQAHHVAELDIVGDIVCLNCGERGHGSKRCRKPTTTCGIKECGRQHHTTQHGVVMKMDALYGEPCIEKGYDYDSEDTVEKQVEDYRKSDQAFRAIRGYRSTICRGGVSIDVEDTTSSGREDVNTNSTKYNHVEDEDSDSSENFTYSERVKITRPMRTPPGRPKGNHN